MIEVSLEDPEENKPLLSGEYHLIDLQVDNYDELAEADEDSYAGITAEFCMLDFSLHKKDPSSGELRTNMESNFSCSLPDLVRLLVLLL